MLTPATPREAAVSDDPAARRKRGPYTKRPRVKAPYSGLAPRCCPRGRWRRGRTIRSGRWRCAACVDWALTVAVVTVGAQIDRERTRAAEWRCSALDDLIAK